ncbi:hypothetical protein Rcae01_06110 [Novipirellula caenicola]|uniref:Uncharacterized protein n=1 Tax=Novipirellula caenicola TaxID=1536901 RepID=A0ABP9VZP1_9BACT
MMEQYRDKFVSPKWFALPKRIRHRTNVLGWTTMNISQFCGYHNLFAQKPSVGRRTNRLGTAELGPAGMV